jgi:transposase
VDARRFVDRTGRFGIDPFPVSTPQHDVGLEKHPVTAKHPDRRTVIHSVSRPSRRRRDQNTTPSLHRALTLNADQREVLRALVEQGPTPAAHGVVRWRLRDLAQILCEDHGVSVSEQTLSRVLRAMGYRKLSARPRHHAQAPEAAAAFKKASPTVWRRSRRLSGPSP